MIQSRVTGLLFSCWKASHLSPDRPSSLLKTDLQSGFSFLFWKDNIFLNTTGIGTGFILADYVIVNGDQSACGSDFCAITVLLWRFVCQELERVLWKRPSVFVALLLRR